MTGRDFEQICKKAMKEAAADYEQKLEESKKRITERERKHKETEAKLKAKHGEFIGSVLFLEYLKQEQ